MKPKHMFYAALGHTTYKVGKLFTRRTVRTAARDWYEGKHAREARRQT
jgi:hypothetical protein